MATRQAVALRLDTTWKELGMPDLSVTRAEAQQVLEEFAVGLRTTNLVGAVTLHRTEPSHLQVVQQCQFDPICSCARSSAVTGAGHPQQRPLAHLEGPWSL